jgi:hypothetical protein
MYLLTQAEIHVFARKQTPAGMFPVGVVAGDALA